MLNIQGKAKIFAGEIFVLGPPGAEGVRGTYTGEEPGLRALRAGVFLQQNTLVFQVLDRPWLSGDGETGCLGLTLKTLEDVDLEKTMELRIKCRGRSLAWITLSDKGARGERTDTSGPMIRETAEKTFSLSLCRGYVIPDDAYLLRSLLQYLALNSGFDLILTTGGTGLGPRDITPEATAGVLEKRLPGFEQAMMAASLQKTPHAAISRAVAGTLDKSIILNLPGSPRGVKENLEAVLPAMEHALAKLQGDVAECATN
ncbi:MogA/MoaB family molybdenum cofactor biosynthesis protein [Desulfonatronospira sp.]|uniref:MogA/MoaB family molybdenum cofactor biosynthesis protein n=1 Tax=Desulfonatronospira sp. TaxID=1962951 RepID=UPI0025C6DA99|nr:MogA/MoaB family molybdenum cofactor biosynthesis protein [Desulfonatronospira sp.]